MKKVIIVGAGPAGLSAGYLLEKNNTDCILFESEHQVGGISKTIQYKGYFFDLGGHRFFTKFDEVNKLWEEILDKDFRNTPRLSRIFYKNRFFNYPLTPVNALFGVGIIDTFIILGSYIKSKVLPCKSEENFEQWVSNRFGRKLYSIFFKTYTEKVWGIPCSEIGSEWAAQRIKGLSLKTAIINAFVKPRNSNIKTLIDEFKYPVLGPGMMYNEMKNRIEAMGGRVHTDCRVTRVYHDNRSIKSVEYIDKNGIHHTGEGSDFVSSMPVTELIKALSPSADEAVLAAASKLKYRSLITIDIIVNKQNLFPDNWIYIHSPEVRLGRIQNFKNWSSRMVPDARKSSLGLEYFCNENDEIWNMPDAELFRIAAAEIERIKICRASDIEDFTIIRVPKAYPVYSTGYKENVDIIKSYLKGFDNLQLIGRYGLFKYNNMDHSIITGLQAAKNIIYGSCIHDTWEINTDEEYQEEKQEEADEASFARLKEGNSGI